MKFINCLKAAWISFRVSQNTQRLLFLLGLLDERQADGGFPEPQAVTVETYRNVVNFFLSTNPRLDSSIWPLGEAQHLRRKSSLLIAIGEKLLYGTD